ncbi:hypothetical protein V5O48_019148 [Marasmius crinis-equi]|uniref:Helitron helicase-like domain-containing protein n=1 Tax=Marasmius crinis-equi TaxID=585013 RepID=A0ABR3EJA1_9AGAR
MFTAFNMMQRHDMLRKTSMMITRGSFAKHAESFVDVDPVTVHIVAERIARSDSVTALNEQEAKVLKLMQEVKVVTSAVQGSAASRAQMHNKIRGMMIDKGLPTFYVPINPADVYHPLVKVLSGQEMEVDSLLPLDRLEPGKVFQAFTGSCLLFDQDFDDLGSSAGNSLELSAQVDGCSANARSKQLSPFPVNPPLLIEQHSNREDI